VYRTGHEHPHFDTAIDNYAGLISAMGLSQDAIAARVRSAIEASRRSRPEAKPKGVQKVAPIDEQSDKRRFWIVAHVLRNPLKCKSLYHDLPQDLRHDDNCEKLGEILSIMSSLAEIQEAIEKLGPEERAELWTWFQEAEETNELVAAVDEGIKAAEEGRVFTLEEVKTQMQSWITK
jgi:predicted transcriptional regulator